MRAVMLFVVQRADAVTLGLADDIDHAYARAFDAARLAGVETLVYGCDVSADEIVLSRPLSLLR
jgi:sugar fermentation stimulation protein A